MAEYIEREALLQQMHANFQQASWYGCEEPMYPIVEETILEAHEEDVAPVVHGFWKASGMNPYNGTIGNFHCSICGGVSLEDSNYCANCGAKMDKE